MILIQKGEAPNSLIQYRKATNAYFDGCNKDDIRDRLLEEQGHLCAYCMCRIFKDTMKIEHWYPENRLTDRECLDYSNMLGCCPGHNDGDSGRNDICDTHKGNSIIAIDPRNPDHIARIKYSSKNGRISSDDAPILVKYYGEKGILYEDETTLQKDIDKTLNLNENAHYLMQNRKAVLDEVKCFLSKKKREGSWTAKDIKNMIQEYEQPDANGRKKSYAGIVLWYLKKHLK